MWAAPRKLEYGDLMRMSHAYLVGRIIVTLNGNVVQRVRAYDCDAGTVTRLATDEGGRVLIKEGNVVEETLHGEVAVSLKPHVPWPGTTG